MKSGVSSARHRLGQINGGWPDDKKSWASNYLDAEESRQAERSRETARRSAAQVKELRDSLVAEVGDIKRRGGELRRAVTEGRVTAREAGEEFAALRRRLEAVRSQGASLVERLPGIAWQYDNPVEAADRLTTKFPTIQHDWPW
jgi:predicted  nucleic acid-binding Zn-ribbon protein